MILLLALFAASDSAELVDEIRRAYDELRIDDAISQLESALAEDLSRDVRVQVLTLAPALYLIASRDTDAKAAVSSLLDLSPNYDPDPNASPKIQALFDSEKQRRALTASRPEPAPPWYANGWVWGGTAVALVAAIATTAFLAERDSPPDGDFGPWIFDR
ncbi:MAG: hypothetical protein AAF654_00395 [Myxococcota bacterium]